MLGTLCSVNCFPFLAVSSNFYPFRYVANQQPYSNVAPCGKCKFFPKINIAKLITSNKLNITEKIKGTWYCKGREIIYATQCSKHKVLYIGHTGEQLSDCFSKHCTTSNTGLLNTEIGDYAKEMYNFYWFSNVLCHKFLYYFHMIMKDMTDFGLN